MNGNNDRRSTQGQHVSHQSHFSHSSARPIIPPRGDYQTLLSFQKAEVVYDITFRFAHKYLGRGDRTVDQMIQSARSCKQNILEGSQAATTSKETEIKLTNVGQASLEELLADFRDYLRIRDLRIWELPQPKTKGMKAGVQHDSHDSHQSHAFRPAMGLMRRMGMMNPIPPQARFCQFHASHQSQLPTDLPWGCVFPKAGEPLVARHPTQLYEFLFHISLAGVLLVLQHRGLFRGQLIKLYIIAYLGYRFATEYLRPEPEIAFGLTTYQVAILFLLPIFAWLWNRDRPDNVIS